MQEQARSPHGIGVLHKLGHIHFCNAVEGHVVSGNDPSSGHACRVDFLALFQLPQQLTFRTRARSERKQATYIFNFSTQHHTAPHRTDPDCVGLCDGAEDFELHWPARKHGQICFELARRLAQRTIAMLCRQTTTIHITPLPYRCARAEWME